MAASCRRTHTAMTTLAVWQIGEGGVRRHVDEGRGAQTNLLDQPGPKCFLLKWSKVPDLPFSPPEWHRGNARLISTRS